MGDFQAFGGISVIQVNGRRQGLVATMAAGVLAMSAASTAKATQVFFADFDGLNGGASATNYTGLTDFVIDSGALDLVKSGDFGIQCAGGAGSCIDLEGSNEARPSRSCTNLRFRRIVLPRAAARRRAVEPLTPTSG